MNNFTIRPPTFDDFHAVHHLITTQNTAGYGEQHYHIFSKELA